MSMKINIGFIAMFFILIITGCGNNKLVNGGVLDSFDGTAKVRVNNKEYECELSHTPEKISRIEIISPKELNGVTLSWEDGKCDISWKDLGYELSKEFLSQESFARAIVGVLDSVGSPEGLNCERSSSDESVYSGKCEYGNFKIKTNRDGKIKFISIPDKGIEAFLEPN